MSLLKDFIKNVFLESYQGKDKKSLRIFDFDDTLVKTDAKIYVSNSLTGNEFFLSPGEYAVYSPQRGDEFDYSDFERLINPKAINWTVKILDRVYAKHGPAGVVVLTARSSSRPAEKFLEDAGFSGIEVVALGDADPYAKAAWIDARISSNDLDLVEFFDDSHRNVKAVRELQEDHPTVEIIVRHIVHKIDIS